jgi:CBS domain containing-hemolysin-like protein
MVFYFTVHVILGLAAMAAIAIYLQNKSDPLSSPNGIGVLKLAAHFSFLSSIAAIITTMANYGFMWAIATAAELFLGAFIAMLIPPSARSLVALASPFVSIGIMGAVWRFWYIG